MKGLTRSRVAVIAAIGIVAMAGLAFAVGNSTGDGHPFGMKGCDHPGKGENHSGEGHGHAVFGNLTDEERSDLRDTVASMNEEGASREEIYDAVEEKLESFGVDTSNLETKGHSSHGGANHTGHDGEGCAKPWGGDGDA